MLAEWMLMVSTAKRSMTADGETKHDGDEETLF